jgi:hypothetical protein
LLEGVGRMSRNTSVLKESMSSLKNSRSEFAVRLCKADSTQESLRQFYKEHVAPKFTRLAKAVQEHLEAV